jgi:hypothetical protein
MSDQQVPLQHILQLIANEEEFEGPIPQYLFVNWSQSPESMANALRQAVRSTKKNITDKLLGDVGPVIDTVAAQDECECPSCNEKGGVVARKDAFINYPIPSSGKINWSDRSWVSAYDDVTYECILCGATLDREGIGNHNGCEVV